MFTSSLTFPYKDPLYPGLKLVGKRYVSEESLHSGFTLLFTHGIGSHKEVWEPAIETLLNRHASTGEATCVREAWSFDWQSHGEAAKTNDAVLRGMSEGLSVRTWADGLCAFLESGHLAGHTLVMVGHSCGATAWILSLSTLPSFHPVRNDTKAIVLVEPSLISRSAWDSHLEERQSVVHFMQKAVSGRRDHWNSRADALQYFQGRLPWKTWDPRALDLYVAHGLRSDVSTKDMTLCCTKMLESAAHADSDPHIAAVERLVSLDPILPVHCVLAGEEDGFVPRYAHDSVSEARQMKSIQYIPDTSHLIVQENPEGVAACVSEVLKSLTAARFKL